MCNDYIIIKLLDYHVHRSVYPIGEGTRIGFNVVIEEGCKIGKNCLIGHNVVLRPYTIVGDESIISHNTVCEGWTIIGKKVLIEPQCHLTKNMIIEDCVFIGPMVTTCNDVRMGHLRFKPSLIGPTIRFGARIGGGACILPDICIGRNAVVGGGAVVVHDVPERAIVVGNPAAIVGNVKIEEVLL